MKKPPALHSSFIRGRDFSYGGVGGGNFFFFSVTPYAFGGTVEEEWIKSAVFFFFLLFKQIIAHTRKAREWILWKPGGYPHCYFALSCGVGGSILMLGRRK